MHSEAAGTEAIALTSIRTSRLDLIPMTPAFLRASLDGEAAAAEAELGAKLPHMWPDDRSLLILRLEQLQAAPALQPWLLRAITLRGSREMVGYIGFHTAPGAAYLEPWSPGGVEFGFSVFPAHRRNGYARESASALMRWAREDHGVGSFVVTIGPRNHASVSLAAALGFVRVGSHVDDVDGPEDVFVLDAAQVASYPKEQGPCR
jgi:[ribosomal protein S5]-alanine N-acetyltransferase